MTRRRTLKRPRKVLKTSLAPKSEGLQFRCFRKIQKGGVEVETGKKSGADKMKQRTSRDPALRIAALKRIRPKVLIYDVDSDLEEDGIVDCIWKQNLEEKGIKKEQMAEDFKIRFRTRRRDLEL